jgi:Domain of unknown function (DUF5664)
VSVFTPPAPPPSESKGPHGGFEIKDSGERKQFDSGMVRDTTEGKIDFSLALDGPMFKRYAIHLTKGAQKYAKRNWMKARGQEELDRFRESALRHFIAWFEGQTDEDHMAAVVFNLNGAEFVREQMDAPDPCGGCVEKYLSFKETV